MTDQETIKAFAKANQDDILRAVEEDDNIGFCIHCGEEHYQIEPDARWCTCDACGIPCVFGAEELMIYMSL